MGGTHKKGHAELKSENYLRGSRGGKVFFSHAALGHRHQAMMTRENYVNKGRRSSRTLSYRMGRCELNQRCQALKWN